MSQLKILIDSNYETVKLINRLNKFGICRFDFIERQNQIRKTKQYLCKLNINMTFDEIEPTDLERSETQIGLLRERRLFK